MNFTILGIGKTCLKPGKERKVNRYFLLIVIPKKNKFEYLLFKVAINMKKESIRK